MGGSVRHWPKADGSPRGSAPSRSGCPLLGAHPIERSEVLSAHPPPETRLPSRGDGISRGLAPPGRREAALPRLRGRGSRNVLMPGAPPPSEPRTSPEAWDCLLSVHSIIHQSHACKFAAALAARKSRWRASRCKAAPLARCCARCVRSRCSRARVPARIAMLSQCVADVQVCSSVWQPANVVPLMMQSWAMQGKCGLCGAWRACTVGEP